MSEKLNHRRVNNIICDARNYGLPGCGSGSAHGCHPCWIRRGQLLLVSHWHVDDLCHVSVISVPTATVFAGCNDSRAYGNPWPQVDKGTLTKVWYAGQWQIDGPWQDELPKLLDTLEAEIAVAKAAKEEKERAAAEQREQERLTKEAGLRAAYQSTA